MYGMDGVTRYVDALPSHPDMKNKVKAIELWQLVDLFKN